MLDQQCGIQDQLCSAYGGINYIEMFQYPYATVSRIEVPNSIWWELERRLVLVFLGKSHSSSDVHKQVIEELQKSRSQVVHLFDEMVRTIPDGVRLTSLKQQGNRLTLNGMADSNAKVSAYMRSLEASEWMKSPDLSITQSTEAGEIQGDRYEFTLNVTVVNKNAEEGADDEELEG